MVNSVSATILSVPTPTAGVEKGVVTSIRAADKILDAFLHDKQLLTTLANQSSAYVPPSKTGVMSVLWAVMNSSGDNFIDKANVKKAVLEAGGGTIALDSLWAQMNPEGKISMSVGDFSTNKYLSDAVIANLSSIADAVNLTRTENATSENVSGLLDMFVGKVDNILSSFSRGTGTVLDLFS